jgi:hypothetical protein
MLATLETRERDCDARAILFETGTRRESVSEYNQLVGFLELVELAFTLRTV